MTRNKPYSIKTERLILRSMCDTDCDDVCSLLTNKQIAKTYMLPDFKSREEEIKLFNLLMSLSKESDRFVYGIDLGGRIIGFINDVEIIDSTIELGFVINPEYHNCGYATETLTHAIDTLHDMGYDTVKTGAFECNLASQRVMEKAGMQRLDSTEEIEYRGVVHRCIMFEKRAR
ncbi:MAG: GNAT family N-acetyltransferase [Clostridia bacterium]|nr:GNAT family N-acetyltransferase [Clostridia bacterium]